MDDSGRDTVEADATGGEIEIECPTLRRLEASVFRRAAGAAVWRGFVVAQSTAPRRRRETTLPLAFAR